MPATDFTILGGDKRIAYIAPVLAARGYRITCFHTSSIPLENNPAICHVSSIKKALENTSVIIAGIPFAKRKIQMSATANTEVQAATKKITCMTFSVNALLFILFCYLIPSKRLACVDRFYLIF